MCKTKVREGVLIVAQGWRETPDNEAVRQAVNQARLPYPKTPGFLEHAMPDISTAVEYLEQQRVDRIIVVPLVISSHPSQADRVTQLGTATEISLTSALNDHPLLAEVLAERLATTSQQSGEEIAMLVGEDTSSAEHQERLEQDLASLAVQVKARLNLKDVRYGFVTGGSPTVRDVVSQAQTEGRVIVTPVLLSQEDVAAKDISLVLDGLDYRYTGQALLPHPNISRFIEWRVAETVLPALQFKQGQETVSLGLNDAQSIAQAAGMGYPCSVLAFRLARIAFRSLWRDVPVVDDLKVVSELPPEAGSRPVFESIAGAANVTYKGDWSEITPESSTFTFTDRATGVAVRIVARESTFGGRAFFALRNKVINKKGTPEEGRLLSEYLQGVLSNLLSRSDEELFTWSSLSPT